MKLYFRNTYFCSSSSAVHQSSIDNVTRVIFPRRWQNNTEWGNPEFLNFCCQTCALVVVLWHPWPAECSVPACICPVWVSGPGCYSRYPGQCSYFIQISAAGWRLDTEYGNIPLIISSHIQQNTLHSGSGYSLLCYLSTTQNQVIFFTRSSLIVCSTAVCRL